jgi:hypothetical protein
MDVCGCDVISLSGGNGGCARGYAWVIGNNGDSGRLYEIETLEG